jgi:hypothetical protein
MAKSEASEQWAGVVYTLFVVLVALVLASAGLLAATVSLVAVVVLFVLFLNWSLDPGEKVIERRPQLFLKKQHNKK